MFRIIQGEPHALADIAAFVALLNSLDGGPTEVSRLFDSNTELFVTRAPGRLDVMGGIADYCGSLVLELPIAEATVVALQKSSHRSLRIVSLNEGPGRQALFEMPLADFEQAHKPIAYETARTYFRRDPNEHWAAYVAGVFLVLMTECQVEFNEGAHILISSSVPEGKGVSSSAALEVAVMQAVAAAFKIQIAPRELALLCQKVENLVVGAPCGVMDQMTSACGAAGQLLSLLCQPAELRDPLKVPDAVALWGFDSGVRHSVSGADYASVRVGAFMGYRIIAELAGLKVRKVSDQRVQIEDPRWGGYLANVSPAEFQQHFAMALPETIIGAEFLTQYQGTTDTVTKVDAGRDYCVRVPTSHPIYENHRVHVFSKLFSCADSAHQLELLGNLMYESHASYSACGLGSAGTDLLVDLVREAGPALGLFGAKITGGGSGGTVAVLGRREAVESIAAIAAEYERRTGYQPHIFAGSSPGSTTFGHLALRKVP